LLGALLLPATSVVVWGVELTALPSPLRIWSAGQLTTPERLSAQENATVTSPWYQPFAFGLVVAVALMVGAVASRLIVTFSLLLPPALVAEQVSVTPAVSLLTVTGSQPLWLLMADSLSTTLQLTLTPLTYQPLAPSVPATVGVMTGAVLSLW
jgi:hypothetical protein